MSVTRSVLLVDTDRELLVGLKESLRGRSALISVLHARDGSEALQILKRRPISLVVAELQLSHMHGHGLLTGISVSYPDIPVVVIGGKGRPDMLRLARKEGAAGFIARPFPIERLAGQILSIFRKESEGGVLHDVSSVTYLQLVEMEQKTCTVRLEDRATGKRGAFFFVAGVLCDARLGELNGTSAAYEMFSWDPVSLWIQNGSAVRQNRIQKGVHRLVLEAARRRDEGRVPAVSPGLCSASPDDPPRDDPLDALRDKIEKGLGRRGGLERIFRDSLWEEGIRRLSCHARKLSLGRLLTGYVDRGDPLAYVVAGGERPAVIGVSRKCPRDKLMQMVAARGRRVRCGRIS